MAIELDGTGLGKYRHLANNQIYYYNVLQHMGGDFYRRVLGYEVLWDLQVERKMMLCLDYYMLKKSESREYYLEELKVNKTTRIHGIRWPRGIAPQTNRFDLQWPFDLKEGESITARINLLDKPHHVDLERSNGEVFTIQYLRYKNYLIDIFRRKQRYETPSNKPRFGTSEKKGSKRAIRGFNLVKQFRDKNSFRKVFKKLSNLR